MYKKVFLSNTFINATLMVVFYFFVHTFVAKANLFGVDQPLWWKDIFLFKTSQPMNFFALPMVFSIYIHANLYHLLSNLALFILASGLVEYHFGRKRNWLLFFSLHIVTLVLILSIQSMTGRENASYSGASIVISGFLSFYFLTQKKFFYLLILFLVLTVQMPDFLISPGNPHALGAYVGLFFALPFRFRRLRAGF